MPSCGLVVDIRPIQFHHFVWSFDIYSVLTQLAGEVPTAGGPCASVQMNDALPCAVVSLTSRSVIFRQGLTLEQPKSPTLGHFSFILRTVYAKCRIRGKFHIFSLLKSPQNVTKLTLLDLPVPVMLLNTMFSIRTATGPGGHG